MCLESGGFYDDSIIDKKANWAFYIAWEDTILVFLANDFYCVIPLVWCKSEWVQSEKSTKVQCKWQMLSCYNERYEICYYTPSIATEWSYSHLLLSNNKNRFRKIMQSVKVGTVIAHHQEIQTLFFSIWNR